MSITLENGRINLDSLVTIEDHLRGLALANRTLDSIKDQISQRSDKKSDWYRRLQLRTNHGSGLAHESANNWLFCAVRKRTLTVFAGSMKMKP